MHYEVDRMDESKNKDPEPSLTEMVQKAIPLLQRSKDGFFLLVEGRYIKYHEVCALKYIQTLIIKHIL